MHLQVIRNGRCQLLSSCQGGSSHVLMVVGKVDRFSGFSKSAHTTFLIIDFSWAWNELIEKRLEGITWLNQTVEQRLGGTLVADKILVASCYNSSVKNWSAVWQGMAFAAIVAWMLWMWWPTTSPLDLRPMQQKSMTNLVLQTWPGREAWQVIAFRGEPTIIWQILFYYLLIC